MYWLSCIVTNSPGSDKPCCIDNSTGFDTEQEAHVVLGKMRHNFNVLSAWIDFIDENNNKTTVFHDCYVNALGSIRKD